MTSIFTVIPGADDKIKRFKTVHPHGDIIIRAITKAFEVEPSLAAAHKIFDNQALDYKTKHLLINRLQELQKYFVRVIPTQLFNIIAQTIAAPNALYEWRPFIQLDGLQSGDIAEADLLKSLLLQTLEKTPELRLHVNHILFTRHEHMVVTTAADIAFPKITKTTSNAECNYFPELRAEHIGVSYLDNLLLLAGPVLIGRMPFSLQF